MAAVTSTAGEPVNAAAARLDQEAARLASVGDPTADIVGGYAQAVRAMANWKLEAEAQREAMAEVVRTSSKPMSSEELRRAVIQGIASYAQPIIQATNRWTALVGAMALFGVGLTGFAMGYAVHWRITPPAPTLTCEEHRGGRVCFVWTIQPTEPAEPQPPPSAQPTPPQQGQGLPVKPRGKG